MKLFSISLLLSSMFVYNQIGHISEDSIENLSLVVNLSQNIQIDQTGSDEDKIAEFCPYFLWVLRDFSLDLKGKNSKEYLEEMLQNLQGSSPEIYRRNIIREKLRNYFRLRDCQLMVRPLANESKLARIEEQDWSSLRNEFREAVVEFEKKVHNFIQPKKIQNKPLTGEIYLSQINNGGVPQILPSIIRVISTEARKVVEDLKKQFDNQQPLQQKMGVSLNETKMPYQRKYMQQLYNKMSEQIHRYLEKKTSNFVDANKLLELKEEIDSKMKKEFEQKLQINKTKSEQQAKSHIAKFMNTVNSQIQNVDSVKNTLIKEKLEQYSQFQAWYSQKVKGPKKYKIYAQTMPQFLYNYFDQLFQNVIQILQEENEQTKLYLQQAREGEAQLRKQLQQYDNLILEKEKNEEFLKRMMETQKREHENSMRLKLYSEECLKSKIEELEKTLNDKTSKLTKEKEKGNLISDDIDALKSELNIKRIEIASLQKKVSEYDKFLDEQSGINSNYSPQLFKLMKDLKSQSNDFEEFQKKKKIEGNPLQNYQQQLDELTKSKQEFQNKEKQKRQELIANYKKSEEQYKKQIQLFNNQNLQLKSDAQEAKKYRDEIIKSNLNLTELQKENDQLRSLLTQKSANLEAHKLIIEQYSNDISQKANYILDMEEKFAILNAQKISLESFKETFPYLVRETLKWTANKRNNIKQAIRSLAEEDQNMIREIMKSVGYSINF